MDWLNWLEGEKKLKHRSAQDVIYRLKRVKQLLNSNKITQNTIKELEKVDSFSALHRSSRSQLRRSIRLYLEFKEKGL